MVARMVMTSCGQMSRTFSMLYDAFLAFVWIYSVSLQASGDFSDMEHLSPHPWYLTRHCPERVGEECHVAQASFGISIIAAAFYSARFAPSAFEVAYKHWNNRHNGYQIVSVKLDLVDEEDEASDEDTYMRERRRYLCHQDALSPVLAFFPENVSQASLHRRGSVKPSFVMMVNVDARMQHQEIISSSQ
ncbi:uncharacterized protein VDAG_03534 [Verticillium dahliae VdLs.17]|uniref:Uncharacterized protein n=1 Tax=Verticillium dahliae (strain VdLs.17 / ATCC MYA-4575 / FGSC 10137) TaxID=498257 RepID=G2WZU2_VERDV|nr:uncharacterized protein VDAG_03534 [Verticillium dahliae VdLs.17]EGY22094.1 hypothetical protein VDAG_03534 [Verticillium dahliae VdLs.17]KAH6703942.1 hypothetical protein EV126DRAFT_337292 [Verticillium dahliae]